MCFSPVQPNSLTWPRPGGTAPCTGPEAGGSRRFLVLSATMGSGHEAVADVLSDRLTALGHHVGRADVLGLLPAGLGLTDYAGGAGQLLRSLQALCPPGPHRDRRIAAGRALFAGNADGITRLESLGAGAGQTTS